MSCVVETNRSQLAAIDRCSECSQPIALQTPVGAAQVDTWLCDRCGSVYFANAPGPRDGQSAAGVRQADYEFVLQSITSHHKDQTAAIRPRDVERLVECLSYKAYRGPEKRQQDRYGVAAPVVIVPLGCDFRITGKAIQTVLTSVSCGGAAFMSATRIPDRYLLIDFKSAGVALQPAVLQVSRLQPLQKAFVAAGQFLSRVRQTTD